MNRKSPLEALCTESERNTYIDPEYFLRENLGSKK